MLKRSLRHIVCHYSINLPILVIKLISIHLKIQRFNLFYFIDKTQSKTICNEFEQKYNEVEARWFIPCN